jgi:hypothetical protein
MKGSDENLQFVYFKNTLNKLTPFSTFINSLIILNYVLSLQFGGQNSPVGIATRYGLNGSRF